MSAMYNPNCGTYCQTALLLGPSFLTMTMTMTVIGTFVSNNIYMHKQRSEERVDSMWPSPSGMGFCGQ